MSSIISNSSSSRGPFNGMWSMVAPYVSPPIAAAAAIIPVFRDMVAKSTEQKGEAVAPMTVRESFRRGVKSAPTVGAIIGTQMVIQALIEEAIAPKSDREGISSVITSSVIVGAGSAPVLAIFNGQTMGLSVRETFRTFSVKQVMAIVVLETAFIGGLSVSDRLALVMRRHFGDNKSVDYTAAFLAGAVGSLLGHPADTCITRWQSGMVVDSTRQLMWGSLRKARAIGGFSVFYKLGKEALNPTASDLH